MEFPTAITLDAARSMSPATHNALLALVAGMNFSVSIDDIQPVLTAN